VRALLKHFRLSFLATGLLLMVLAQAALLSHSALADHDDDALCALCVGANTVGAALPAGALPELVLSRPFLPRPLQGAVVVRLFQPLAWQARAPPTLS
jgi:hypothetical protein